MLSRGAGGTGGCEYSGKDYMLENEEDHRGRSTGPTSPEGKANSSKNAIKHGMRAKKTLIMSDESQEDYDRVKAGWRQEFEPEGYQEERLITNLIVNDWTLSRGQRRMMEAETAAGEEGLPTADEQHEMDLMLRYKTTAERAFYRAWEAMRGLRKDIMRENKEHIQLQTEIGKLKLRNQALELRAEKKEPAAKVAVVAKAEEAPKSRGQETFQGQNNPKKLRKIVLMEQWAEITVVEGKTLTQVMPSNAVLIEEGKAMLPPPDLVYRRMNFVDGVPSEYHWATKDEERRRLGMCGIQRMTVDTWLDVIDREQAAGTGHLGPTGVGNLPRPKERGGCDCEVCAGNQAILDRRAERKG